METLKYFEMDEMSIIDKIANRESFKFEGTRTELGLMDFENRFMPSIPDFNNPVPIGTLFAQSPAEQLVSNALGIATPRFTLFDIIRIAAYSHKGRVFYQKTDEKGDNWIISIEFN